ncbi:phenylalanine--tRNA ligase subunit beta [Tepidicaulis sp. LMO-SS28]|uniref:phenylalanine--tRNA ligase subunit beta n=1 Tax=Tepidicaulis sp. LMO-SS28 TaxID=3447455 RepID=UPI003EE36A56
MKFTLSWLKDHLETDASLEEIADKLTMIGLEVEGIEDPAAKLGAFSVARIVEADPHPDADKLKLCKVEALIDGKREMLQVVCGAPNAKTGLLGVFAPPGSTIPANGMVLKPTKIRGVESNGMMCSERELELSDEHTGIIELAGDFDIGTPAADALGVNDPVIEIAITPNRPDCLGVYGVARDLAAAGLGRLKDAPVPKIDGTFESPIKIEIDAPDACPHFVGRMVKGVKNVASPDWMQKRLAAIGLRPINALVDVTNYISYDRGRPLHVYDAAKLKGNIRARLGQGETFLALDGKEYTADETMCVIADEEAVLGFGGIMGGEESGSTEATTHVFIESAYFDPVRTAATGRKTGINSDARYRFERGVDPSFVEPGCDLAAQLITEICGGEISKLETAGANAAVEKIITFNPAKVEKLTGVTLAQSEIVSILKKLGFFVSETGGALDVGVPSWRPDVDGEADLVEEVVRIHGLDGVISEALPRAHAVAESVLTVHQHRMRTARRALAARGLVEAVTWSFVSKDEAVLFGGGTRALELANPISSELSDMRPSLLPGLIAAARRNLARGLGEGALCEVGQTYEGEKPEDQKRVAAGLRQGTMKPEGNGRHWQGKAGKVDVFDAKADALALLEALGAPTANLQVYAEAPAYYHPGRSGELRLGPKNVIARFGELHPRVLDKLDLPGPAAAFEVFIEAIPQPKAKPTKAKPALTLFDLQPLTRDFAFVLDADVSAEAVMKAARGAEKKLVTDVSLFDVFEGGNLGEGKKSLAIEVKLQPQEKTLTDEEIEAISRRIVEAVQKATGGTLRG